MGEVGGRREEGEVGGRREEGEVGTKGERGGQGARRGAGESEGVAGDQRLAATSKRTRLTTRQKREGGNQVGSELLSHNLCCLTKIASL